ncbi:MAG: phytanoyl-CoA dioxygenase family protein [Halioglobus sp.]
MSNAQITPTYTEVPRFAAGSKESLDHLESEGFVVIANALSSVESEKALELTWDYLERLGTGIDRNDMATWGDDRWPIVTSGGIVPALGIGHCEAQWFTRSVPSIKQAFAAIWGDDDLLSSFDGMALWRPTDVDLEWETTRGGSWLHVDQHPITRPGMHCVQGAVTLLPTSPSAGGNILIPKSHKWFAEIPETYAERLGKLPGWLDHFRFPTDDVRLQETPPIMAHMEAGDMMLWDSRTVHCSSPGIEPAAASDPSAPALIRAASLVCMMPKSKATDEVIAKRRAAVDAVVSTTNWTDRFFSTDDYPEMLKAANLSRFTLPPVPQLTKDQLALVG